MFTPQELQERSSSLEKAVFGGYSVDSVEELLTPLTQDYTALYKENAVLKSKMKVLVERMEEYRKQEENINKALLTAQRTADDLVAETERKCAKMLSETEQKLRQRSQDLQNEVEAETQRVALAKESAAKFIVEIEDMVQAQLSQLERIKQMNVTGGEKKPKTVTKLPTTPQSAEEPPAELTLPEPTASEDGIMETREIPPDRMAREIEENISRLMDSAKEDTQNLGDTRAINPVG